MSRLEQEATIKVMRAMSRALKNTVRVLKIQVIMEAAGITKYDLQTKLRGKNIHLSIDELEQAFTPITTITEVQRTVISTAVEMIIEHLNNETQAVFSFDFNKEVA